MRGRLTNAKLQYYRHNYCLVCMTGLLGCRWHRYKQSTRDSRKRDLFWFSLFSLTFLYIIFYFYFWLIVRNSFDDLNWYLYGYIKTWIPWYRIILGLTCAAFAYCVIVMCLYLCHVIHGHQLYVHPVHIVITIVTLACCVAVTVVIDMMWASEWTTVFLSLKITGPFLQIGAVVLMTAMTWLISLQWFKLSKWQLKVFWLLVYVAVMVGLYISPLYINSPCVTHGSHMPPKPKTLAHRGASQIAPENTLMAFEYAYKHSIYGVESDVHISRDCVPFLLHDDTLERTTNVRDVFPDRAADHPSSFNISELKMLDAGTWFLENDPWWTAGDLAASERAHVSNLTLPTLEELSALARLHNNTMMLFDLKAPPKSHPCYNISVNVTMEAIKNGGFPVEHLWWLENTFPKMRPSGVVQVAETYHPVNSMHRWNVSHTNLQFTEINEKQISEYESSNISVNMWTINSPWFYSLYWCMGAASVTTDACHTLEALQAPVWHLVPSSYLILWVTVDILSAVVVITIFIVQRIRLYGTSFSPETISLNNAARNAQNRTHRSRNMKEKLLYSMNDADIMEDARARHGGVVNQPSSYSMSSMNNDLYPSQYYNGTTHPDVKYEVE